MSEVYRGDMSALSEGASVQFKQALNSCRGNLTVLKKTLWGDLFRAANANGEFLEFSDGRERLLAPFFEDSETNFDDLIINVGRDQLVVTDDLYARGVRKTLPNFMAKFEHKWNKITDSGSARRGMHLQSTGERGRADITQAGVPLPLTFWTWEIMMRDLLVAEAGGFAIDTTHAEHNIRRSYELIEESIVTGFPENHYNLPVYGMINHPNVSTYTLPVAWDDPTVEGVDIFNDFWSMYAVQRGKKRRGNKVVYITPDYSEKLASPWSLAYGTDGSIRNYLINNIPWLLDIISVDYLPADTVVMLDPVRENVELLDTGGMTVLPYDLNGTFVSKWIGFTGVVPAFKDDSEGITGTLVATP